MASGKAGPAIHESGRLVVTVGSAAPLMGECRGVAKVDGRESVTKAELPARRSEDARINGARIEIALRNGRRMTLPASLTPSRLAALLSVVDPG